MRQRWYKCERIERLKEDDQCEETAKEELHMSKRNTLMWTSLALCYMQQE